MKLVEAIQQGESGTILEEPTSGSQQIDLNTPHQFPLWNLVVSAIQRFLMKGGGGRKQQG